MKKTSLFIIILGIFTFTGCTPSISILINQNNSAEINVKNKCFPEFNSLIETFVSTEEQAFFNEDFIKKQFEKNGFTAVSVKTEGIADISISSKIDSITRNQELMNKLFRVEKNNGKNSITLTVDSKFILENQDFIPDVNDYLELLMAPIYTGENLSEEEYLEIIASFYGNNVANSLKKSNIIVRINCPEKITKVEKTDNGIGTIKASDNKAEIQIPISKYLCSAGYTNFKIEY